jgi:hypothetical protein
MISASKKLKIEHLPEVRPLQEPFLKLKVTLLVIGHLGEKLSISRNAFKLRLSYASLF